MNAELTSTHGTGIDNIPAMAIHGSSGTTNYYYLKDLSNTVLALANSSGSIVESYVYDAYGNVTIKNSGGSVISTSAYGNRFLFQGREYDYATQLYHFRARWYDTETGRWLSNDPIGISGGLNLYAFCSNDPVNFVDPMGFYSKYSNAALLAEDGCGCGTFTDPDTGEEIGGAQVLGMMVGGAADGLAIVAGGGLGGAAAAGIAAAVVDDLINDATNTSGSEDCCPDDSGYAVNAAGGVMCGVGGGDSPAAQYGREQHKKLKEKVKQKGVLWSPEKHLRLIMGKNLDQML